MTASRSERSGAATTAAMALVAACALGSPGCGGAPMALHAPDVARAVSRNPSPVEVEPIATGAAVIGDFMPPGAASVLTAGMNAELRGRGLHGGPSAGTAVRCTLDRFAVRTHGTMTDSQEMLAVYADLSCEATREADHVPVWRGELRARTFSEDANVLGSDASTTQRLLDRALSDAARELASDLAVRALGLLAEPSARVFTDAEQQRRSAGLDDTAFGAAALQETGASTDSVLKGMTDASNPFVRAAAWNVAAMAAGPGDPWIAAAQIALDEDPRVRFLQYKALARLGNAGAMAQLRGAAHNEGEPLLAELLADVLSSGGIGLARAGR
jgi:hypothetical protein